MKKYPILITAVALTALAITTACGGQSMSNSKEASDGDAQAAKQQEQRRQQAMYDSLYQDSVKLATLNTRDLAFFELRGPVKSVTFTGQPPVIWGKKGVKYVFSPDGLWQNKPSKGIIDSYRENVSEGGEPYYQTTKFNWKDGRVVSETEQGYEDASTVYYAYFPDHPQTLMSYRNSWGAESFNGTNTSTMKNVQYDAYGNWTTRTIVTVSKEWEDTGDGPESQTSETSSKSASRVIEYYDSPSPSAACPKATRRN